jgi:hypothetical protein
MVFSASQRRWAAIALAGLAVLIFWFGVVAPLDGYIGRREFERRAKLAALARNRALIQQDGAVDDALKSLQKSARWSRLYESQKADKAGLQMQTDLRAIFKAPNNPTSMTAQPASTVGPLTKVSVKLSLSMPIDQFTDSLGRLQANPHFFSIENLTIQAPAYQAVDTNPLLAIQIEVAGYMVTPGERGS